MSSISMAFADQKTMDSILLDQNKIINDQTFHKQIRTQNKLVTLNLSESLGVQTNDGPTESGQSNQAVVEIYHVHNMVALSENLGIVSTSFDQHLNSLVKQNSERITTAERIFGFDKTRSNGKYLLHNEIATPTSNSLDMISTFTNLNYQFVNIDYTLYANPIISKFSPDMNNDVSALFTMINLSTHEIQNLYNSSSGENNTIILVLLIPFSGYILIRSEELKLKISNKNRILSFCFMAILISSAAVTPISVSPAFLQIVYAETMNVTQSNQNDNSSTISNSPISFQSNATDSSSFIPIL